MVSAPIAPQQAHRGAPMIMEFIHGRSLGAVIGEQGRLPPDRVAVIGTAMLEALQEAHAAGIVHRDLKPDNVLLAGRRIIITAQHPPPAVHAGPLAPLLVALLDKEPLGPPDRQRQPGRDRTAVECHRVDLSGPERPGGHG